MTRADDGLGFLLQYENIARYEDGEVFILDRRVYPRRVEFVRCRDYGQVAAAIRDMVTQSGGPWLAAALGMVSAAHSARDLPTAQARKEELARAAHTLAYARPTTSARMAAHVARLQQAGAAAVDEGRDPEQAVHALTLELLDFRYRQGRKIGEYAAGLLPHECNLLTQCFAETLIGFTLLAAREQGKHIALYCPETRPYLQGARLTASVAYDQGVPVTVITDNMPGYLLYRGRVHAFISAADVITLDGYVVNKIGTYQIALAAHANRVPYYVLGTPSAANPSIAQVEIEERDPDEVLHAMGVPTTQAGVRGYYPAFDITPPHLVGAVVSTEGVFSPWDLPAHFAPVSVPDE